jgi:hypothetical protein
MAKIENDKLTVGEKKYLIKKVAFFKNCVMCKQRNNVVPCISHAALVKHEFSMEECWVKLGRNQYPEEIKDGVK